MILAFYSVGNSLGYDRDTFDGMAPEEALKMIEKLDPEEYFCYDTSFNYNSSIQHPGLDAFAEDYNDECLDGGFWCVVLDMDWK